MYPARARIPGIIAVAVIAGAPLAAHAEPTLPAKLGEGFELVAAPGNGVRALDLRKGKQRTRFGSAAYVASVQVDAAAHSVTLELENWCNRPYKETWTYAALGARLENTSAYQLHRKANYKLAALGFARAVALDPTWNIPAYNLASAQTLLGDQGAAIKALAPWLASAPITTYVQVTMDRELAPLLARPELQAIHAKQPGTVTVTADGITGKVAVSADRTLLALVRAEHSWGSSSFTSQLEILEAATGQLIATTPLVTWNDSNVDCYPSSSTAKDCSLTPAGRTAAGQRAAVIQTMLRELGFVQAVTEPSITLENEGRGGKKRFSFPNHKLGLVVKDGAASVLQNNTELGSGGAATFIDDAIFVEQPRLVVIWSTDPGSEGCDSTNPSHVSLIPVKTP